MYEKYLLTDPSLIKKIEDGLLETYFSAYDQNFLLTGDGKEDIDNNVFKRYNQALTHIIPWVNRYKSVAGARLLEIGCGTGSSTAALAQVAEHVVGYDIQQLSVDGARKRLSLMGLTNVALHVVDEHSLLQHVVQESAGQYDIILLYAVLEHQTIEERIATLQTCWQLLANDGALVVVDTPNLLTYFDEHTSRLPFQHLLPNDLYAQYARNSDRSAFSDDFPGEVNKECKDLDISISRWGRGVSYHDFEVALGPAYKDYVVSHGFEDEIIDWYPNTVEEQLLRWYIRHKEWDIPLGFTRWVLNLVLQKTDAAENRVNEEVPVPEDDFGCHVKELTRLLAEKEQLVEDVYSSKTWRLGNFLAAPYRKLNTMLAAMKQR